MKQFLRNTRNSKSFAAKLLAGASALALAPAAFAQTSSGLAAAVTSNVDTAELIAIGVVVLGISGIVLMVRSGKKTAT